MVRNWLALAPRHVVDATRVPVASQTSLNRGAKLWASVAGPSVYLSGENIQISVRETVRKPPC